MADKIQFGDARAGGIKFDMQTRPSEVCEHIESMLTDALDGTLSATDQALFDAHISHCASCSALLADARRGAAWLDLLRSPRPEPPVALLERILSQTSGAQTSSVYPLGEAIADVTPVPAFGNVFPIPPSYGVPAQIGAYALAGKVLPFRSRITSLAGPIRPFARIVLQPRLAMTAAMAFFSVAMTMNLTGVRIQDLSAKDLRPENLKRDFYAANVRIAQFYEGIRVVHEFESRVEDLRTSSNEEERRSTPPPETPANPDAKPDAKPEGKRPAPGGGTSRRETPGGGITTVAAADTHTAPRDGSGRLL